MSQWVDAYVVEDHEGNYMELFGDQYQAEDYANLLNDTARANSEQLTVRHTIVDIEG